MANRKKRTPQKDGKFLAVLRQTGNVKRAREAVGYSLSSVYEWRDADARFAADWAGAIEEYATQLEEEADRRGVKGYVTQTYTDESGQVHEVRHYSDNLLMFRLKGIKPDMYREHKKGDGVPPQVVQLMVQKVLVYLDDTQAHELLNFMAAQLGAPSGRDVAPRARPAVAAGGSPGTNGHQRS